MKNSRAFHNRVMHVLYSEIRVQEIGTSSEYTEEAPPWNTAPFSEIAIRMVFQVMVEHIEREGR